MRLGLSSIHSSNSGSPAWINSWTRFSNPLAAVSRSSGWYSCSDTLPRRDAYLAAWRARPSTGARGWTHMAARRRAFSSTLMSVLMWVFLAPTAWYEVSRTPSGKLVLVDFVDVVNAVGVSKVGAAAVYIGMSASVPE